jgi:hypothetical protein
MKQEPDSDSDLMARGPSFARAAWLANMLRAAEKRELAEPTDADIQEWRAKVVIDPTFEEQSDANKDEMFRIILTIRHRLWIYSELVKFEEEDPAPLLRVLRDLVAIIPNYHGLFTLVADEMSKIDGTTTREEWQRINGIANTVARWAKIIDRISEEVCQRRTGKPKVYNGHTVRRLRQQYETGAIRDCLSAFGVNISKTGPGEHHGQGDAGLNLMACLIDFVSGNKPALEALRTRLRRAEPGRAVNSGRGAPP